MRKRIISSTKLILERILEEGSLFLDVACAGYSTQALYRALDKYHEWEYENINQKLNNSFYYLKGNKLIKYKHQSNQLFITVTVKGRDLAKKYQINNLKINQIKPWDRKWRVLFFDIQTKQKTKRDTLRNKLKVLGFFQLQKSVWIYPYQCQRETDLLRDYFSLDKNELILITTQKIESDHFIRKYFKLH